MSELISSLGIDWRLLIAQIINFGILVFLLTRFLYKPILKVLAERKAKIEENEERTKELDQKLQSIREMERETMNEARKKSDEIISSATTLAKQLKENLLAEAAREADKIVARGKETVEAERKKIVQDFKRELGIIVAASIEKTVGDVVDAEAEKKLQGKALAAAEASYK